MGTAPRGVLAVRYTGKTDEEEGGGEGEMEWALVEFQGEVLGAREAAAAEAMAGGEDGRGGTATIGEICCSASTKVGGVCVCVYIYCV